MIDAIIAVLLGIIIATFYVLMCVLMTGILSVFNHRVFVLVQNSVPMIVVIGTCGWAIVAVVILTLRYIAGFL